MTDEWRAIQSSARAAHVWVDVTGTWTTMKAPGLLTEMRQVGPKQWQGYVILARPHQGAGGVPVTKVEQGWFAAEHIRPVNPGASSGGE